MQEEYNSENSTEQGEILQVLIIGIGKTSKKNIKEAMRNAYLSLENANLKRQLARARARIFELESNVETAWAVAADLDSQIPYASSGYCEHCGQI